MFLCGEANANRYKGKTCSPTGGSPVGSVSFSRIIGQGAGRRGKGLYSSLGISVT